MATYSSLFKIDGHLEDLSFYKMNGKNIIRHKGGPSKEQIKKGASFERLRENQAEFSCAFCSSKLLRKSLFGVLGPKKYPYLELRMAHTLHNVMRTDSINPRGKRRITAGDITQINGYRLTKEAAFDSIFKKQLSCNIDRASGSVQITIPAFNPSIDIVSAPGACFARISLCAAEIDFSRMAHLSHTVYADVPVTSTHVPETILQAMLTAGSGNILLAATGIEFFQVVNGLVYPLNNKEYHAVEIIATQAAEKGEYELAASLPEKEIVERQNNPVPVKINLHLPGCLTVPPISSLPAKPSYNNSTRIDFPAVPMNNLLIKAPGTYPLNETPHNRKHDWIKHTVRYLDSCTTVQRAKG